MKKVFFVLSLFVNCLNATADGLAAGGASADDVVAGKLVSVVTAPKEEAPPTIVSAVLNVHVPADILPVRAVSGSHCDMDEEPVEGIDIAGISREKIISALYLFAQQPMRPSVFQLVNLSAADLAEVDLLQQIDYLNGRIMKIYFCDHDVLEVGQFNHFYGKGRAQQIIAALRTGVLEVI